MVKLNVRSGVLINNTIWLVRLASECGLCISNASELIEISYESQYCVSPCVTCFLLLTPPAWCVNDQEVDAEVCEQFIYPITETTLE